MLDERGARIAALLLALAPGALLYGATSADAVFLTLGLLAAWPLATRSWVARAAGAVVLAAASFFAWSLLAVGAWAAIVTLRREGWRTALALSALCGAVLVVFYALLHAGTGFDPIGTIRATEDVYRAGIATLRPYWYWLFGSPVAFLLVLGVPISWLALRALAAGRTLALAIFAVIAVAAVAGFTKAETERIWLFLAPFVCLAAAEEQVPVRPVLAALAAPGRRLRAAVRHRLVNRASAGAPSRGRPRALRRRCRHRASRRLARVPAGPPPRRCRAPAPSAACPDRGRRGRAPRARAA